MTTALCDKCGYITDVVFKEKKYPKGICETYFECERCFYHYTSFVTDRQVRKLQRTIKELSIYEVDKRMELQNEINNQMGKLKYNLVNFGRADL